MKYKYNRSKSTKRFKFNISRDHKSHKTGANTVTIGFKTPPTVDGSYPGLTMTVKEAKAFQKFLNEWIPATDYQG